MIDKGFIEVRNASQAHQLTRRLNPAEISVLNLGSKSTHLALMDDRETRNEASELGFQSHLILTSTVIQIPAIRNGFFRNK